MGYGDYLMLSGIVRETKHRIPGVSVTARRAEGSEYFKAIFAGNPYLTPASALSGSKGPVIDLPPVQLGERDERAGHIRWRTDFTATPGDLFLTDAELQWAATRAEEIRGALKRDLLVVLNPFAKPATRIGDRVVAYEHHVNKEWGEDRYRELVRALSGEAGFVQTVAPGAQASAVAGAHAVECGYRQAAALLVHCDLYAGCEGGLHHAAAALDRRGVVFFGAWISPRLTGYPIHDNLYRGDPGDACGSLHLCPHCSDAMASFSVEEVVARIRSLLA